MTLSCKTWKHLKVLSCPVNWFYYSIIAIITALFERLRSTNIFQYDSVFVTGSSSLIPGKCKHFCQITILSLIPVGLITWTNQSYILFPINPPYYFRGAIINTSLLSFFLERIMERFSHFLGIQLILPMFPRMFFGYMFHMSKNQIRDVWWLKILPKPV